MTIVDIARECHEMNKAYCEALGDLTQLSWEEAPEWQKKSAIAGVKYRLANPESTPADNHDNWLREKAADGWKYGPVKDVEAKEHPCFVAYDQLPVEQRVKDYLFRRTVDMLKSKLVGEQKVEQMAQDLNCDAPRGNPEAIDGMIASTEYSEFTTAAGTVLTSCVLTLDNGFTVTGEPSVSADKRNHRPQIAREVAYSNARDKVWQFFGFRLVESGAAKK